jgi:hypothetical protein
MKQKNALNAGVALNASYGKKMIILNVAQEYQV